MGRYACCDGALLCAGAGAMIWDKELLGEGTGERPMGSEAVDTYENVTIFINTANAAFDEWGPDEQLAEILRVLARKFEEGPRPYNGAPLLDSNGNQVGFISIEER